MRKEAGYSQTAIAQISGMSKRTYQNYESGERSMNNAPAEQLFKLSITLGITMEDLLTFTNDEKEQLRKDIEYRKEIFEGKVD